MLSTRETSLGSQELFDIDGHGRTGDDTPTPQPQSISGEEPSSSSSSGSSSTDSDGLDSDVEVFSKQGSPVADENIDSEEDETEVRAFNAKLAAALGTRAAQKNSDDQDDALDEDLVEEDMAEEEMTALDEKLAAVFRARKAASTSNKKNQQWKETKDAMIVFKKRVLDLVDIYLKREQLRPIALDLALPLIVAARQTTTKAIRTRAHEILEGWCSRCKGNTVPQIDGQLTSDKAVLLKLQAVHEEAGRDDSRAHANACSKASILLVKTLLQSRTDIGQIVDLYAETRKRQLCDKSCRVQPVFFTIWNNWCTSARQQLVETR